MYYWILMSENGWMSYVCNQVHPLLTVLCGTSRPQERKFSQSPDLARKLSLFWHLINDACTTILRRSDTFFVKSVVVVTRMGWYMRVLRM